METYNARIESFRLVVELFLSGTSGLWMIRSITRSFDKALQAANRLNDPPAPPANEGPPASASPSGGAPPNADDKIAASLPPDVRQAADDDQGVARQARSSAASNGRIYCPPLATFPAQSAEAGLARLPILVIDHDYHTYETLCSRLSNEFRFDAAFDETQALIKIKTRRYSTILLNLMMPGLWSEALIRDVTAVAPTTPVILVTRLADAQRAIRVRALGAFDCLIKPFDNDEVELSIRRAVSHHGLAEAVRRQEQQLAECTQRLESGDDALRRTLTEPASILTALMTVLEARNVETRSHSERVVAYSLRLARDLGLDEAGMQALALGALLHDIGKIGIADQILLKPEPLTSAEWVEMRKHTEKGAQIIAGIPALRPALDVITQHHERWDGTGYPHGLAGMMIDIKARIFAVADALDAITSDRPYDPARSYAEARKILVKGAGKQFDPAVVAVFCRVPLDEWASLGKQFGK